MPKYTVTLSREVEVDDEDILWESIGEQWCNWMDYASAEKIEDGE